MHGTAMRNARAFHEAYARPLGAVTVVEIGSQDVNGSIRAFFGDAATYIGVDFADAKGVDVVLDDPYVLPFETGSADIVVCNSCLEHSDFFWLSFLEIARILKGGGLCYLNVPSNGPYHGYPVDCWRFYPDAGHALARWSIRRGFPMALLESFTTAQSGGTFNDFVAVFVRDPAQAGRHPNRMLPRVGNFENAYDGTDPHRRNAVATTEDQRILVRVMAALEADDSPEAVLAKVRALVKGRLELK
jgi:SAM-dependent methyltransferase